MKAAASINFDRAYYCEFYENLVMYRTRWRRLAIPLAVVLVALTAAASILLLPVDRLAFSVAGGLFIAAIVNLVDAATHRLRWVHKRLTSVAVDKNAEFVFTDDAVQVSTPNSEGVLKYKAFGQITLTPNGLFLVPESGVSIFVPRTAFASDEDFHAVSQKLDAVKVSDTFLEE